jgi:hypothetical protein
MQRVEGSNPFSRFARPALGAGFVRSARYRADSSYATRYVS